MEAQKARHNKLFIFSKRCMLTVLYDPYSEATLLRLSRDVLSGLLDHFDEDSPDFAGVGDLAGEVDAGAFHAFGGFEAKVEAESIDRGHGSFGGFEL